MLASSRPGDIQTGNITGFIMIRRIVLKNCALIEMLLVGILGTWTSRNIRQEMAKLPACELQARCQLCKKRFERCRITQKGTGRA